MELISPVSNLKSFWSQMEYAILKQLHTTQPRMASPNELCKHSNLAWRNSLVVPFRSSSSHISLQLLNNPTNHYRCFTFWIIIWLSFTLSLRLVAPNLEAKVRQNQYQQKDIHDFHTSEQMLVEGDSVPVKNFSFGDPWSLVSSTPRLVLLHL